MSRFITYSNIKHYEEEIKRIYNQLLLNYENIGHEGPDVYYKHYDK